MTHNNERIRKRIKSVPLHFRGTAPMVDESNKIADELGTSRSQVIFSIIEEYLERDKSIKWMKDSNWDYSPHLLRS